MKKTFLLGVSILFAGLTLTAQNSAFQLTSPLPVAPSAAAISKYGDIPVSLSNGLVDVSVPIYSIKTGSISLPVSISYHASGIKIEELATDVGLGWSLNYGATITRQVRGLPDEGGFGWNNNSSWVRQYLNGSMNSDEINTFLESYREGVVDGEPDIFYYILPGGISGKFFLDSTNQYVTMPRTNLKIAVNDLGELDSFTITTDHGIKYCFSTGEMTSSYTTQSIDYGPYSDGSTFNGPTSWYVSRIVDPNGNEIDFNYTTTNGSFPTKGVYSQKVLTSTNLPANNFSLCDEASTASNAFSVLSGRKISKIVWREGSLSFTYAHTARKDLVTTDSALAGIQLYNNVGQQLNSYNIYTSYFGNSISASSNSSDSTLFYRLRLDSIREFGFDGSQMPPWKFTYNAQQMEDPLSNNQDSWGYYNGKSNVSAVAYTRTVNGQPVNLGADRSVDSNYTQADLLQKVQYPTGGTTLLEYESNRYAQWQQDTVYTFPTNFFAGLSGANTAGQPNQYDFTFDDTFAIAPSDATYNGTAIINSVFNTLIGDNPSGDFVSIWVTLRSADGSINMQVTQSSRLYLPPGVYTLHGEIETEFGDSYGNGEPYAYFYVDLYMGKAQPPGYYDFLAGGVRIKRVTNSDANNVASIKEYYYNAFGQNYSSGSIGYNGNLPGYSYDETDYHLLQDNAEGDAPVYSSYSCSFTVYSSSPNYPLLTSGGGNVTYSNILEVSKDQFGNTNGKTEYYYTSYADQGDITDPVFPFPPACSFEWERGLLLKQNDYRVGSDGSYFLVRQKVNNYTFLDDDDDTTKRSVLGFTAAADITYDANLATEETLNTSLIVATFPTISEIYYRQSDKTIVWDMNNPNVQIVDSNYYTYKNYPILLQSQQRLNSKGEVLKKVFKYPGDFGDFGFISSMNQFGLVGVPIEEIDSKINVAGQESIVGGAFTAYKNQPVEDKVLTVQSAATIPVTQFQSTTVASDGSIVADPSYAYLLQYNHYDRFGNIIEQQKTNDLKMAYIWDYNSTLPIAEVKNGDSSSVAYTSFEADGKGSWVTGTAIFAGGITGNQYYYLNSDISRTGLNSSATYIVSYWSTSGAFTIPGTVSGYPVTGKTVNVGGVYWTYHEHKVSGQSGIQINGSGGIDELRLYPANAQMTTYTYAPLVGATTQCDVANRITYYFYDGLGRLSYVKDQDGNIIKTYQYHYKGQ